MLWSWELQIHLEMIQNNYKLSRLVKIVKVNGKFMIESEKKELSEFCEDYLKLCDEIDAILNDQYNPIVIAGVGPNY